jgi:hypothetical protein
VNHHEHRKRRSAEASITSGLIFTVAFGLAGILTQQWWFIFPLVFAGILPLAEGLRRLRRERLKSRGRVVVEWTEEEPQALLSSAAAEKQVLLAAKEEKGIVTPALVALKTELTIQEAEKLLEEMARKGYAVMNVRDDGRIEYEFPEFRLP